jgi:L-rhamnose-H+ transport protein
MAFGIILILVAGIMGASFAVPMRYMRRWEWENIWTVWSVVALLIVPWVLALSTVSTLGTVYADAGMKALCLTGALGFLWGIAGFLFGLSVELVGMSLTFAVVNGMSSAIGSLVPLLVLHRQSVFTSGGLLVSVGVFGVVMGVVLCSWAGSLRAKSDENPGATAMSKNNPANFWRGLAVTFSSALLAPCLNLGIAFGHDITSAAVSRGTSPAASTNALLAILFTGGFLSNIAYCVYRIRKHNTAGLFAIEERNKYFALGALMGALWIFSYAIYGSSLSFLGEFGTVAGWPILMAAITIASSLWDIAFGDWRKGPLRIMAIGVVLLIAMVGLISVGMARLQQGV